MKFFCFFLLLPLSALAQTMTLEMYLNEVQTKNGGVRATLISAEARELRKDEGTLFFKPTFFLTGEYSDDQRPTTAPAFQGTQTLKHTLKAGFGQNLRTGTKASLAYNYYKTQINGASPALLPNAEFFDIAPTLEVTQSLWRNFLGSEFTAQEDALNAANEAQKYADKFQNKQLLMQAKNAYWRLYFAQYSMRVQKESLERASKLREWNRNRVRSNLVDDSELLQAEASLQNREVEMQDTLTELASAQREFNSIREEEGEVNLSGENDFESHYILNAVVPTKKELRDDVLAAIAFSRAANAQSDLNKERNKPILELYGTYAINGRDKQYADARDQAFGATRPQSIVGVRFVTSLDIGSVQTYRKSYAQEKTAAELTMKRKTFEVAKEWDILVERFENLKHRLVLNQKLGSHYDFPSSSIRTRFC